MAATSQVAANAMNRIRLIEVVESGMRGAWRIEWCCTAMSVVGGWVMEGREMAG